MAQVNVPQKRDDTNALLQIGGAALGAYATGGSPQGAMAGASAGGMIGGLNQKPQNQPVQAEGQAAAMARRQQQMAQDNLQVLKQAEAQLPSLPEPVRQQYAPAIVQARMLEEQKRGLV